MVQRAFNVVKNDAFWKVFARGSAIAVLGIAIKYIRAEGVWKEQVLNRFNHLEHVVNENAEEDNRHHNDKDLHMPYQDKEELFVTRREWAAAQLNTDRRLTDIKEGVNRIENKFDNLVNSLRQ